MIHIKLHTSPSTLGSGAECAKTDFPAIYGFSHSLVLLSGSSAGVGDRDISSAFARSIRWMCRNSDGTCKNLNFVIRISSFSSIL